MPVETVVRGGEWLGERKKIRRDRVHETGGRSRPPTQTPAVAARK